MILRHALALWTHRVRKIIHCPNRLSAHGFLAASFFIAQAVESDPSVFAGPLDAQLQILIVNPIL